MLFHWFWNTIIKNRSSLDPACHQKLIKLGMALLLILLLGLALWVWCLHYFVTDLDMNFISIAGLRAVRHRRISKAGSSMLTLQTLPAWVDRWICCRPSSHPSNIPTLRFINWATIFMAIAYLIYLAFRPVKQKAGVDCCWLEWD